MMLLPSSRVLFVLRGEPLIIFSQNKWGLRTTNGERPTTQLLHIRAVRIVEEVKSQR
jgi:hypothetical protein